jgi:hypothetical protein
MENSVDSRVEVSLTELSEVATDDEATADSEAALLADATAFGDGTDDSPDLSLPFPQAVARRIKIRIRNVPNVDFDKRNVRFISICLLRWVISNE